MLKGCLGSMLDYVGIVFQSPLGQLQANGVAHEDPLQVAHETGHLVTFRVGHPGISQHQPPRETLIFGPVDVAPRHQGLIMLRGKHAIWPVKFAKGSARFGGLSLAHLSTLHCKAPEHGSNMKQPTRGKT